MGHCTRRCNLYFRVLLSIFILANVYILLTVIKNKSRQSHHSHGYSRDIHNRIVLCIRTSQNCQSRLKYLLQSWIPTDALEQSNLYLITDEISNPVNTTLLNGFQHVIQTSCPKTHGRFDLCCKTAHEFDLFYNITYSKPNIEWLCRFDDDQYVNLKNLYSYLSTMNSSKPYYIGRTSINHRLRVGGSRRTYTFATYGAGVCFSHALLQQLRPHVKVDVLPHNCIKHGISDDAYIGYLTETIINVSLLSTQDLFHSHLEQLDRSFRRFTLHDISHSITLGFSWDRYTLNWLPVIHKLINLVNDGQIKKANESWLFLRNYEIEHPENVTNKYDESCESYTKLRKQSKT